MIREGKLASAQTEQGAGFRAYARFTSVDPDRNRFRYYTLTWQPMLFGGGALIRSWGRIGTTGRTLEAYYSDRASAKHAIDQIIRRRLSHGYALLDRR